MVGALLALFRGQAGIPTSEALREVKSKIKEIEAELSKWDKGLSGECLVASILEQQLPDSYYVINDLVIRAHNRRVQIDHVLVGPTGVVCIETKNITGNFFMMLRAGSVTRLIPYKAFLFATTGGR